MCGIYCSDNLSMFEILEEVNRKRGNFSTGLMWLFPLGKYDIIKEQGTVTDLEALLPESKTDRFIYLGHNQAPTSSEREWKEQTSHPFRSGDWVVAHNGVLTNFKDLIENNMPKHRCKVDSSIIPALLAENDYIIGPPEDVSEEVANIASVLELLEGTFALWIVNIRTCNVYFARQGSTLFYKGTNVSSVKGEGFKEVTEGIIYRLDKDKILPEEGFNSKSPFLTL